MNYGFKDILKTAVVKIEDIMFNFRIADTELKRIETKVDGKAESSHGHNLATTDASGFMSMQDKTKLNGVQDGATNYQHPVNHPASMITESSTKRFVSDSEKTAWNGKANGVHSHSIGQVTGLQGEIDGLKSSVVSGKQLVVNAIDGKYGYNTGLTTNNTHNDYAWWIGQIPKAPVASRMNNSVRVTTTVPATRKNFDVVNGNPYALTNVYLSLSSSSARRFRFTASSGDLCICYGSNTRNVAKGTSTEIETSSEIAIFNPTGLSYTITPVYWSGPVEGWSLIS